MERVLPPVIDLVGPNSLDAAEIVLRSMEMTDSEARALSSMWEMDNDPQYLTYCDEVMQALETSGRTLPMGWFEAVYEEISWAWTTKALHAIADTVVATLARDLISFDTYNAMTLAWTALFCGSLVG